VGSAGRRGDPRAAVRLDLVVEVILVDAYGEDEQYVAFLRRAAHP
jgi:hypothetical protein